MDTNMIYLAETLNSYPAVTTVGSCGGHADPGPGQWAFGTWYMKFEIAPTDTGWRVLEFLAWAINNDWRRAGGDATLLPTAPPSMLNEPGKCLAFVIESYAGDVPDHVAAFLRQVQAELVT